MNSESEEESDSSFSSENDSDNEIKEGYLTFRKVLKNNDDLFEKIKYIKNQEKLNSILERCNKSQIVSFLKMIDSIYLGRNVSPKYKKNKKFLSNLKEKCEFFQNCGSFRGRLSKQKALEELQAIIKNTDLKTFKSFFKAYNKS